MSSRSEDLTADLLQDLTAEQAAPAPPPEPGADAFVETSLFLAPSTWKRPGLGRDGRSIAFRAGPVQVRIGRRR